MSLWRRRTLSRCSPACRNAAGGSARLTRTGGCFPSTRPRSTIRPGRATSTSISGFPEWNGMRQLPSTRCGHTRSSLNLQGKTCGSRRKRWESLFLPYIPFGHPTCRPPGRSLSSSRTSRDANRMPPPSWRSGGHRCAGRHAAVPRGACSRSRVVDWPQASTEWRNRQFAKEPGSARIIAILQAPLRDKPRCFAPRCCRRTLSICRRTPTPTCPRRAGSGPTEQGGPASCALPRGWHGTWSPTGRTADSDQARASACGGLSGPGARRIWRTPTAGTGVFMVGAAHSRCLLHGTFMFRFVHPGKAQFPPNTGLKLG